MLAACFLAFCTGFISLSLEMLWIRLFSFANHSLPQAFAYVLAVYLVGIAIGAVLGKWCCNRGFRLWRVSGMTLMLASGMMIVCPYYYGEMAQTNWQLWIGGMAIMLTGALTSVIFPIAHHLGTPINSTSVGQAVSRVYVSNIMGATLGPFFIGMVLLSYFTTQQCFILCALLTFMVAVFCLYDEINTWILSTVTLGLTSIFIFLLNLNGYTLIEKVASPMGTIRRVVENQYGIVITYKGDEGGDIVSGGNVYDGRTNLDPVINSNHINRLLVLAALNDKPEHVLMIGLSIGTWLKLMTGFPGVKSIDVVEINPGYLQAIHDYPKQQSALSDPRVHLYIDDGRRFLKAHPNRQYDLIVMNTTYYWRAYTSNLLSQDFLRIVKAHMNKGAVLTYNTTASPDVFKTAASLFNYAYLYENFVIAADFDWRKKLSAKDSAEKLNAIKLDGSPLFISKNNKLINEFLHQPLASFELVKSYFEQLGRQLEVVTDQNLITEYKFGIPLFDGNKKV